MCLSVAYELRGDEKIKLCEHVSGISLSPGRVHLCDIMGENFTFDGSLASIDLMKNEIVIAPEK